jgi:hypothetical protein
MLFGLDIWIWLGYITAFVAVAISIAYGWIKHDETGDD